MSTVSLPKKRKGIDSDEFTYFILALVLAVALMMLFRDPIMKFLEGELTQQRFLLAHSN